MKPLIRRLARSMKDPIGAFKRGVRWLKYHASYAQNPEGYWTDLHRYYRFDLRGVGHQMLSPQENQKMYAEAKEIFLSLFRRERINFEDVRMLDIGCGTGFYAQVFRENGGKHYVGIDITDKLFDRLRPMFGGFEFRKQNICTEKLQGIFDLVIMVDVTQHITKDEHFSFAMQNIKSALSDNGLFIVTSWLQKQHQRGYYEVARPMEAYRREFPEFVFGEPLPFRDKFIFSIKRQQKSPH